MAIPLAAMALGAGTAYLTSKLRAGENKANTKMQVEANKELADYNTEKQMEVWNQTNYPQQVEKLKEAGLNPAILYAKGGMGGQLGAAGAGSASMGQASNGMEVGMQAAMMQANKELIESQARKNNVEADKLEGVDTEKSKAELENTKWQMQLNKELAPDIKKIKESEGLQAVAKTNREVAETNDWLKLTQTHEKDGTDTESRKLYLRGLKAAWEETITRVDNARKEGKLTEVETAIREFEKELTDSGIGQNSPWWSKLMINVLDKAGINPLK